MASSSEFDTPKLESALEMFIENTRQINIMVADFQPQAQTVLNQKIQKMVTDLQEIDKLKAPLQNVQMPIEVFEYVDKGINPQLYTKKNMNEAVQKNEEVKEKVENFKKLKAHMLSEFSKRFPKEIMTYRAIRAKDDQ